MIPVRSGEQYFLFGGDGLGETFWKKFPVVTQSVTTNPIQKLFGWVKYGYSLCKSGASNVVDTNSEKTARDLVTSAQWDVCPDLLCKKK